jgi:hypothetical protein
MSFRQFGGLQYAARNNIVSSNYSSVNNLSVSQNVGQPNSYINFQSDISGNIKLLGDFDLSGNLNVTGNVEVDGNIDVTKNIVADGTITAYEMFITGPILDVSNSVVTKAYVDLIAAGFQPKTFCACATTTQILDSASCSIFGYTYVDNSYNGVYTTTTNVNTNGTSNDTSNNIIYNLPNPLVIDGLEVLSYDRVLVKNEGVKEAYSNNSREYGYAGIPNGIYFLDPSASTNYPYVGSDFSSNLNTLVRSYDLYYDSSCSHVLVTSIYGDTNNGDVWIQTLNNLATDYLTVGVDAMEFVLYLAFNFTPGNGLNINNSGRDYTLNVDYSLNFLTQVGIGIGSNTNNYVLDVSGNSNFNDTLNADNIKVTNINNSGGITGATGSFSYLSASQLLSANGGITGPTGSFSYLSASKLISAPGGITGATGSFSNLYTKYLDVSGNVDISGNLTTSGTINNFTILSINPSGGPSILFSDVLNQNVLLGNGVEDGIISLPSMDVSNNTGLGFYALNSNKNSTSNTAVGCNSIRQLSLGSYNTAIGSGSLENNLASNYNSAIGYNAGFFDSSGNSNTFLGASADVSNNGANSNQIYKYSTALGQSAIIDASNQIVLGGQNSSKQYPSVKIPGAYLGIGGVYNPAKNIALDISGNENITGSINLGGGITGKTGSFSYLSASQLLSANGGITGATGSFSYLSASQLLSAPSGITGATGSFSYLSASQLLSANGGITGATGSFSYLSASQLLSANGGITGATGSFSYLSASQLLSAPSGITGKTGSFSYLSASQLLSANGGITGATGSFSYLSASQLLSANGGITGKTGSFSYLSASQLLSANGGITGASGSFSYLSASQLLSAPSGITGATGSFTYLNASKTMTAPTFIGDLSGNANTATNATYATNISNASAAAGEVLYQTGTSSTGFTTVGTSGYVLTSGGSGQPTWTDPASYSQWNNTTGGIYYNGGNVGIGTSSPNTKLDVSGNIAFTSFSNYNVIIDHNSSGNPATSLQYIYLGNFSGAVGGGNRIKIEILGGQGYDAASADGLNVGGICTIQGTILNDGLHPPHNFTGFYYTVGGIFLNSPFIYGVYFANTTNPYSFDIYLDINKQTFLAFNYNVFLNNTLTSIWTPYNTFTDSIDGSYVQLNNIAEFGGEVTCNSLTIGANNNFTITTNISMTYYNPFVYNETNTAYNYYLVSTSNSTNLNRTISSNINVTAYVLVVGPGGNGATGGAGGGGGGVIYGSFIMQSNKTYTIQAGTSGSNSYIQDPSGNNIVIAYYGQDGGSGSNVYNGGNMGAVSYNSLFTVSGYSSGGNGGQWAGSNVGDSNGTGGGGGALAYNSNSTPFVGGGNGGPGYPNTSYNTFNAGSPIIFADGLASNILFGGGGGGGGATGFSSLGSQGGNGGGQGYHGGLATDNYGSGGGGGGSGFYNLGTTFNRGWSTITEGQTAVNNISGWGGNGGVGGGGGGGGFGTTSGTGGHGGNGVVMIYFDIGNALNVNGNANITGQLTVAGINVPSDYRIKQNVQNLDSSFIVDKLNPVTYLNTLTHRQDIGVIAHELQQEYPMLVNGIKDGKNYQSVNYNGLIGILINEIKLMKQEMRLLKSSIQKIENNFENDDEEN